jgi:hypothetical protein
MANQYRLEHDPEYKALVELLGDPTWPPENEYGDTICRACGAKINPEEDDFTTVETDHHYNMGPTVWLFCSAECLKKKLAQKATNEG